MYLNGLSLDPDARDAHQSLRDISLKRKASGGKDLGMFKKLEFKKPSRDDKTNMLNAERLLAYDPGNLDLMLSIVQSAYRGGYWDTVMWMAAILLKANAETIKPAPDVNKFLALKDVYKALGQWKLAADACAYAVQLKPNDMDLSRELKDIGANQTIKQGNYQAGGSFRDSIRDREKQEKLLKGDMDFQSVDVMQQMITDAERELSENPNEPGKIMKLVEALVKTEIAENENRAIEILQHTYDRTQQYRFRMHIGDIKMKQMSRMERSLRRQYRADPKDEALKKDYIDFRREQVTFELSEFKDRVENYPTETKYKYDVGRRQFELGQFSEAIPTLQNARQDPKYRYLAGIFLGRAFFEAGYLDEADDTFATLINEYQLKGDDNSKLMYYWRGRVLELKGNAADAIKHYSQVAQWDFNYLDVQARIKNLRAVQPPK
jgi:hypothetical protein